MLPEDPPPPLHVRLRARRKWQRYPEEVWTVSRLKASQEKPGEPLLKALKPTQLKAVVLEMAASGHKLGDGAIAVRINNLGFECSRADVYRIRTGKKPPDGGGFDEHGIIGA